MSTNGPQGQEPMDTSEDEVAAVTEGVSKLEVANETQVEAVALDVPAYEIPEHLKLQCQQYGLTEEHLLAGFEAPTQIPGRFYGYRDATVQDVVQARDAHVKKVFEAKEQEQHALYASTDFPAVRFNLTAEELAEYNAPFDQYRVQVAQILSDLRLQNPQATVDEAKAQWLEAERDRQFADLQASNTLNVTRDKIEVEAPQRFDRTMRKHEQTPFKDSAVDSRQRWPRPNDWQQRAFKSSLEQLYAPVANPSELAVAAFEAKFGKTKAQISGHRYVDQAKEASNRLDPLRARYDAMMQEKSLRPVERDTDDVEMRGAPLLVSRFAATNVAELKAGFKKVDTKEAAFLSGSVLKDDDEKAIASKAKYGSWK